MPSIAFLHPDLGIGGAERLIVDCALALKDCDHSITIFTSHHDKNHCFEETKNGQLNVICSGDWIPRSIFGRLKAFWAYLRMIYLTIYFILNYQFDIVICDQVSSGIPLLRLFQRKCIFYCHFPDQLLTKRDSLFKKIYRYPIDYFEEWTTKFANIILVNSHFTDEIFHKTFKSLANISTEILYPCINLEKFDNYQQKIDDRIPIDATTIFLSINRYERKKNLSLAIEALKILYDKNGLIDKSVHLIIAGGYDDQNVENIEHYEELVQLAKYLKITKNITFLKNLSDKQKHDLLSQCTAVVYTPENEHFGIVPIEAMYMNKPVIAVNSGGPKETIIDNETGILCESNSNSFSNAMLKFIVDKNLSDEMGRKGHDRVVKNFNFTNFKNRLNNIVMNLINAQ